jgi:uncharacterized protein
MKITSTEILRSLYPAPTGRTKAKVLPALEKHSKNFIQHSPFLVIATVDAAGNVDNSPRGGEPGFVHILDDKRILIPDAKGNNRIDSLVNIVERENVGLLFFIPGVDETLRLNGKAYVSTSQDLMERFDAESKAMNTCIVIEVQEVFLHCAKALMRSRLWSASSKIERADFPTMGQMLKDQLGSTEEAESQEDMIKRYQQDL